jgi:hypothetical protein
LGCGGRRFESCHPDKKRYQSSEKTLKSVDLRVFVFKLTDLFYDFAIPDQAGLELFYFKIGSKTVQDGSLKEIKYFRYNQLCHRNMP